MSSIPKVVRDLLWTVTSPHILSGDRFPVLPAKFGVEALNLDIVIDWLKALVEDPAPLLNFLQDSMSTDRSLALGVYFSKLLEFWLRFCPHIQMDKIEIGKQIVSSTNRTVGQLKFLFRCTFTKGEEEPHDFHVESSIKFFLLNVTCTTTNDQSCDQVDETSRQKNKSISLEHYVGPHLGENLAWRVQEVDRKLAMRQGESVHAWLKAHYSDNVQSYIVLRGYLFEPLRGLTSTSETSMGHDWILHRHHTQETSKVKTVVNPAIATNHLRGWWTADIETDLPAKVQANAATIGKSRFVILPKLHWLCPVIAVEDKRSGKVVVKGEERLNLEDVEALQLEELIVFVRKHFEKDETKTSSAVAMPLLVAEIVGVPSHDETDSSVHWFELSRGFILDSTSWDPSPLSQEPVRYKRSLHQNAATGQIEREYEVRRTECAEEGFIKPDVDDTVVEEKSHQFSDPATIGPRELCQELVSVLNAKSYTHAELKRSTREYLQWRQEHCNDVSDDNKDETAFLRACIEYLIFEGNNDDNAKHTRRVGYLLVDVFCTLKRGSSSETQGIFFSQNCAKWMTMLVKVACYPEWWEYLNLVTRAIDLTVDPDEIIQWIGAEKSRKLNFLDQLLAARNFRWNAIVVEIVRVLRIDELVSGHRRHESTDDAQKINVIFTEFVEQHDWQNAERLASVIQDQDMVQTLFKHLSLLNMTKALKRLHHNASNFQKDADEALTERDADLLTVNKIPLSHSIDHAKNRSLNRTHLDFEWKYVDCFQGIKEAVRRLEEQESKIFLAEKSSDIQSVAQNMLVAIDCEWRPQFLAKAQADLKDDPSYQVNEDKEGLSLYQLAVGKIVYVVDVQVLGAGAAAPLNFIRRPSSRLMLIGFCVSSDIQRIKNSFPEAFDNKNSEIEHQLNHRVLELRWLALSRHVPARHWGLSRLYRACLGEQLDKEQQCSDWGLRPLSTNQIEYAAKDAFAVQRLAWHLLVDITFVEQNCSMGDCVRNFLNCYIISRNFSCSWTMATELQPLGKQHVELALQAHGIKAQFMRLDPRVHKGLVVKSIALLVRKEIEESGPKQPMYLVVVLPLNRSIDMQALAALLEADTKDILLADQKVR